VARPSDHNFGDGTPPQPARHHPYARARGLVRCDALLDAELGALRRTLSRTRSVTNRVVWREAMQKRSTRIARVLRLLPRLVLAPTVDRTKGSTGWLITVTGIDGMSQAVIEVLTITTARTIEELSEPISVQVHRRDLVDVAGIEELQHDETLTVVFTESGP
jgi:hypothetical protein